MTEEQTINITDPKVWNKLPIEQRVSAITELQSILVTQSLRHTDLGERLVKRKNDGVDVSKEILLIEHKLERSVDLRTRRTMGAQQMWRVRLWPIDSKNPTGTSKLFAQKAKIARTNPLPTGSDLFCIICSDGKAFLTTVSLDSYLTAIAPKEAEPLDTKIVQADEIEGPDTFENIVALITKAAPSFDWSDWLQQRVVDGTTLVLPGGIFMGIRKRVAAFIEKAHAEHVKKLSESVTSGPVSREPKRT